MTSKYALFGQYLATIESNRIELYIDEISSIVGGLPDSARKDRTWWGNSKHKSRTQANAWISAGWKVDDVYLHKGIVVFRKTK
jgi:hypothetical protein